MSIIKVRGSGLTKHQQTASNVEDGQQDWASRSWEFLVTTLEISWEFLCVHRLWPSTLSHTSEKWKSESQCHKSENSASPVETLFANDDDDDGGNELSEQNTEQWTVALKTVASVHDSADYATN